MALLPTSAASGDSGVAVVELAGESVGTSATAAVAVINPSRPPPGSLVGSSSGSSSFRRLGVAWRIQTIFRRRILYRGNNQHLL